MCSYVVDTSNGKKNVLLLTTLTQILDTTIDDGKEKLAIYKLYDFTKGGMDIIDQRMGSYSCKPKSRRWPIVAFSYIVDTARVNASTLFALNNRKCPLKQDSFEFGMDLALSLITPFINVRSLRRLGNSVRNKIAVIVGPPLPMDRLENLGPSTSEKKSRCHICVSKVVAEKGGRAAHNKLATLKSLCQSCGKHMQSAFCTKVFIVRRSMMILFTIMWKWCLYKIAIWLLVFC